MFSINTTLNPAKLPRGRLLHVPAGRETDLEHYLYVPVSAQPSSRLFVTVHGISGNAREHAEAFAPLAEEQGIVLIAPSFCDERFKDYQRLGRMHRGLRADFALRALIYRISDLTGITHDGILLFGYSGGGQFVHRYVMAHPAEVLTYVVGAAGWYTFPDVTTPYPRGVGATQNLDVNFDPGAFLRIPAAVIVGERDIHQGYSLNKSQKIVQQQGAHRLERAERWIHAMRSSARAHHLSTEFELFTMPRCNHRFAKSMRRGRMAKSVFAWFRRHLPSA